MALRIVSFPVILLLPIDELNVEFAVLIHLEIVINCLCVYLEPYCVYLLPKVHMPPNDYPFLTHLIYTTVQHTASHLPCIVIIFRIEFESIYTQ